MMFCITDGHAFDPVVEVAEVEYATFCPFSKSNFLSFIVMFCNGAGQILLNTATQEQVQFSWSGTVNPINNAIYHF